MVTTTIMTPNQMMFFFFKQKTAYEITASDWSSDVCSSDLFGVAALVSYVSRFMTLEPGDCIATGTPAGVGMGVKPAPVFLRAGDVMRLGVDRLGEQRQEVHAWDPALIDS